MFIFYILNNRLQLSKIQVEHRITGDLALLQRRVAVAAYWGNFSGKAEMRWIYENQN